MRRGGTLFQDYKLTEKAMTSGVSRTAMMGSEAGLVRAIQAARETEACFRSDKRLTCKDFGCEWRDECCRLIAVWRR